MSCVIFLLEGLGKLGVVCRCYLSQQDVYSLGSAFSCLMSLFIIEHTHTHRLGVTALEHSAHHY